MRGDVMGNSKVVFDAIVFDVNDIKHINDNIIDRCVEDFVSKLPEIVTVFGIDVSPSSFISMKELKKTFEMAITTEETLKILTQITGLNYDMKIDNFYIWSNKINISNETTKL
jgi:hypothetical protein